MIYIVRCIEGGFQPALSYRGALQCLRICGPDAAVFTLAGKWVAGRTVGA